MAQAQAHLFEPEGLQAAAYAADASAEDAAVAGRCFLVHAGVGGAWWGKLGM